ncbi:MAG: hypothetical protein LM582_03495 [Desulfurococcaceae archaeon]|nr:hypothetical protein [Desulfurococcaceae archaeon]
MPISSWYSECVEECKSLYSMCLKIQPNKERECLETYNECIQECGEEEEEEEEQEM